MTQYLQLKSRTRSFPRSLCVIRSKLSYSEESQIAKVTNDMMHSSVLGNGDAGYRDLI
jgi:hypothetical protein